MSKAGVVGPGHQDDLVLERQVRWVNWGVTGIVP